MKGVVYPVKNRLNVLYQFNEKYVPYAGVSVTSLFENNKDVDEICVYLMMEGVCAESKDKFVKLAEQYGREVRFPDTEALIQQMKDMKIPPYRNSYAANMRMFFPTVLDENIDRLIYLDSDTVVCDSLLPLANYDMSECPIAMCYDSLASDYKTLIGFERNDPYFNSGVLVFDVKKWISEGCTDQIIRHVKENNANYGLPDQDLLNIVFRNRICPLLPEYNFQPIHVAFPEEHYLSFYKVSYYHTIEQLKKARKHPVVLHFERFLGEFPWHKDALHPDTAQFDHYLAMSPWADYEKQKENLSALLKIEQVLYKGLPSLPYLFIFKIAQGLFLSVNYLKAQKR